jgi:hypothetical protein
MWQSSDIPVMVKEQENNYVQKHIALNFSSLERTEGKGKE